VTARRQSAGFTLIEVLIGATLLAVMMTLLTGALFSMTRSARAGEARMEEIDSTQLVYAFLRRQLQGGYPLTERVDGNERVLFDGRLERLRFVGHLPLAERGGLQFIEVAAVRGVLEMRYRDASPDVPFARPDAEWRSRALLLGVRRSRWRYFGARDDESAARWTDEWVERDRLPELIHLELTREDDSADDLIAEVRVRSAVGQAALFREPPERAR
jgi:prepilin-type N-terminal cleavage/methylation domain-containing protein